MPLLGDVCLRFPVTDRQTGQIRGAEGGGLGHARANDRHFEQIALELHQQIIRAGTAVHAEFLEAHAGIGLHGAEDVVHLISNPLQRRPGDMGLSGAAREAAQCAARVLVPMRRAKSGEGGHEVHTAVVRHGGGEFFDFLCALEELQPIA